MDFVKKNITLIVVLGITALISLFLVWKDYCSQSEFAVNYEGISEQKQKLSDLYGNPNNLKPVDRNEVMIKQDTKALTENIRKLQRVFGKPYRKALQNFAAKLSISEQDLLDQFKEFYENSTSMAKPAVLVDQFLNQAFAGKNAEIIEAKKAFAETLIPANKKVDNVFYTMEPASQEMLDECLAFALGIPRTMAPPAAVRYIATMQNCFLEEKAIPGVVTADLVKNATFDLRAMVPPQDDIPYYMRHFQMFEYLFWCLRKSGVERMKSLERINPLYGDLINDGKFLKFSYRLSVIGDLNSIRGLVNAMQLGHDDNRIFVIKMFQPVRNTIDDVDNALKAAAEPVTAVKNQPAPVAQDPDAEPVADDPTQSASYGAVVVGADRNINVTLDFDYIIYVGDELKPKSL